MGHGERLAYYYPIEDIVTLFQTDGTILCPRVHAYRTHGIPLAQGISITPTPTDLAIRFRLDMKEFNRKTTEAVERGLERLAAENRRAHPGFVASDQIRPLSPGPVCNVKYAQAVLERTDKKKANEYWDDLVELHVAVHPGNLPFPEEIKNAKHIALLALSERGVLIVEEKKHYVPWSIPLSAIRTIYTNNLDGVKSMVKFAEPKPEVLSKACLKQQG